MSEEEKELLANMALVADPPAAGISSPGAALAAALHCLLVSKGPGTVVTVPTSAAPALKLAASFKPPADWQAEGPNEWNTEYSVDGCLSPFKLVVALHRNSNRVFVHASEAGNVNNIQVLGLTLDNYIPPESDIRAAQSWDQLLQNIPQLLGNMNEHIITPLLRNATPGIPVGPRVTRMGKQGSTASSQSWTNLWGAVPGDDGSSYGGMAVATAATVAAAVLVGGVWLARARRG